MRAISLIFEYLLIIILILITVGYTIAWFNSQKIEFQNIFSFQSLKEKIKLLDIILENIKYFDNATKDYKIAFNGIGRCFGPVFVILSDTKCNPETNSTLPFQGYIITINNKTYIYDPLNNVYYRVYKKIYNNLLYGCIEGRISYVINSTGCDNLCVNNCDIKIIKEENKLYIR